MTTDSPAAQPRRPFSLLRLMRTRPRLFIATAIGIAVTVGLIAVTDLRFASRLLIGWDTAIALYLVLALRMMARSDVHRIRRRAATQDEGQLALMILTVGAALASLGAIFAELAVPAGGTRHPLQLILAAATIVLSWAFIHIMFSLHYAHEFYGARGKNAGMSFPGDEEPDYWDFVYFSFVIGMCAQVSDVTIGAKHIRRIALVHSIVSFMFNATLLALTVNIAASAI